MIQNFGISDGNPNSEMNFMGLFDEIITSELNDDPNFNTDNWTTVPKKRMNIEVYKRIKDITGSIIFIKYSTISLLFLYIKIFFDYNYKVSNKEIISDVFSNEISSIYFIIYFSGILYTMVIFFKENKILNNLNFEFDIVRDYRHYQISFIFCHIIGIISRFLEISDTILISVVFIYGLQHFNFMNVFLILIIKLTFILIQIRLYFAVSNLNGNSIITNGNDSINTQTEDLFLINQFFNISFIKDFLSQFINKLFETDILSLTADNQVKPLKILQLSDLAFTLDLYLIENNLYEKYIINRHKETHEFNISIYYLWKVLSKDIPLNILKIFLLIFMNLLNRKYLIMSLILSNINITLLFIYIYINKQVINDLLK